VARNRALEVARGGYIAFLDDDDSWLPEKLARQVAMLDRDETIGFTYGDVLLRHPDGSLSGPVLKARQKQGGALLSLLLEDCFIHPSTLLARRSLLDRVGHFNEELPIAEDYDLWLRMARAARAACLVEPLVQVGRHAGEISHHRELLSYQGVTGTLEKARTGFDLSRRDRLLLRRYLAQRYTHLGLLHLRAGRRGEATPCFTRALRLNPFQRSAWLALAGRDRAAAPR
jgi:hypothetical protein